MKFQLVAALATGALAFPSISTDKTLEPRAKKLCTTSKLCDKDVHIPDSALDGGTKEAIEFSKKRTNCGALHGPCTIFDAKEQYVSNKGKHRYIAPKAGQIRGPCPGLNAAANHGYLPRDGVPSLPETVFGLAQNYGMSPEVGAFLAAYAIALDGDVVSAVWSIGGPPAGLTVLGPARGISFSHNKYEGDTSIARCDAYVNNGDAHSLSVQRFKYAYESCLPHDRCTLDGFSRNFAKNTFRSENTNPYYFAPFFSTTIVAPAAYNFVINFMSNHSETEKSGYLDGKQFKEFFAVTGEYPHFKWLPGQERIPDNWYRRPSTQGYTAGAVFADNIAEFRAYPNSLRLGGNTHGTGTYVGVDVAKLSGGSFKDTADLLKGDNLACFLMQNIEQGEPDIFKGAALKFLMKHFAKAFGKLSCPAMGKLDKGQYKQYPGANYNPHGPGTTC